MSKRIYQNLSRLLFLLKNSSEYVLWEIERRDLFMDLMLKNCSRFKELITRVNEGSNFFRDELNSFRLHLVQCEKCYNSLNETGKKIVRGED